MVVPVLPVHLGDLCQNEDRKKPEQVDYNYKRLE